MFMKRNTFWKRNVYETQHFWNATLMKRYTFETQRLWNATLVLNYYTMKRNAKSLGIHECAGHNAGNVDRSIGLDKPHPTARSRAGAYCLYFRQLKHGRQHMQHMSVMVSATQS